MPDKTDAINAILTAAMCLMILACGDENYLGWGSNDDSPASCQYDVSQALDKGYFDLVLMSSCATHMDRAAAYFGRAGFDVTTVVNVMIEANDSGGKPLRLYLLELVDNVTHRDIQDLHNSKHYFSLVKMTNGYSYDQERDARYYRGAILGPVISFAYLKAAIDPDGNRQISSCDLNGNGVPDEVDATSCAVHIAEGAPDCSSLGVTVDTDTYRSVSFEGYSNIYNGVEMDFGIANSVCTDSLSYKLLYSASTRVAVTSMEKCVDSLYPLIEWNCPYEDESGSPESVLDTFNDALNDAIGTMDSLGFDPASDVYHAVDTVANDACGGAGSPCTAAELQVYMEGQFAF